MKISFSLLFQYYIFYFIYSFNQSSTIGDKNLYSIKKSLTTILFDLSFTFYIIIDQNLWSKGLIILSCYFQRFLIVEFQSKLLFCCPLVHAI